MYSCHTVLDYSKSIISDNNLPILDDSVFLHDSNYSTDNYRIIDLCQVWVNSRESDMSIVWRPNTYKSYPASRFREKIIYNKNGECKKLMLSPNDAHCFTENRWRLSKIQSNRIIIYNSKGEKIKYMTINKLDSISLEFQQ